MEGKQKVFEWNECNTIILAGSHSLHTTGIVEVINYFNAAFHVVNWLFLNHLHKLNLTYTACFGAYTVVLDDMKLNFQEFT